MDGDHPAQISRNAGWQNPSEPVGDDVRWGGIWNHFAGGTNDLGTAYMLMPGKRGRDGEEKATYDFGASSFDIVTPDLGFLAASVCPKNDKNFSAGLSQRIGDDNDQGSGAEALYGADQGGENGTGAVYLLTRRDKGTAWTETILYNFRAFQSGDAASPSGELVRDSAGNLYGVTAQGGANNLGAVYEVFPPAVKGDPWTENVLFSFNGADGTLPSGRLLLGRQGQLYGTTDSGGIGEAGTVFELGAALGTASSQMKRAGFSARPLTPYLC